MKRKLTILGMALLIVCCSFLSCTEEDPLVPPTVDDVVVTLKTPALDEVVIASDVQFEWSAANNTTGDNEFTYDLYLSQKTDLLSPVESDLTQTELDFSYALIKGGVYYWKVVAKQDGAEYSSTTSSFIVQSLEQVTLLSPAVNSNIRTELTFEWEALPIEDGVPYTYKVYAGDARLDPDVAATQETYMGEVVDLGELVADASLLPAGSEYYWYVTVEDGANFSISEQSSFFMPASGYPDVPTLSAPENNTLIMGEATVDLQWSECKDSDGSSVTYDVYYLVDGSMKLLKSGVSGESTTIELDAIADGYYSWLVESKDSSNNASESDPFTFTKVSGDTRPLIVDQFADPGVMDIDDYFTWEDLGDGYSYTLSIKPLGASDSDYAIMPESQNLSGTSCQIKNKYTPGTIKTGVGSYTVKIEAYHATEPAMSSLPIHFTPKTSGTFVDKRGDDVKEYKWVRLNTQVWMAENLATDKLLDGTPMTSIAGAKMSTESDATAEVYLDGSLNDIYDVAPSNFYDYAIDNGDGLYSDFSTRIPVEKYLELSNGGYVYSMHTAYNSQVVPEGWHTLTQNDVIEFLAFLDLTEDVPYQSESSDISSDIYKLLHTDYGGSDYYGLGFVLSPIREYDGTNAYLGWRSTLWNLVGMLWVMHEDDLNTALLSPDSGVNLGYRIQFGQKNETSSSKIYMEWRYWSNQVCFPIRCLKD